MCVSDTSKFGPCRGVGGVGGGDTDDRCSQTGYGVHDVVVAIRGTRYMPTKEEGGRGAQERGAIAQDTRYKINSIQPINSTLLRLAQQG
jgi:hypothetical protein